MESEEAKLFIGGVSEETNRETLRQHFSKYGKVKQCLKIRDRGIGFVTFADPLMAENALQEEHIILGRKVDVKPAKPRTEINEIDKRKIFVGGLPSTITPEEFQTYFGRYGPTTDAVLIHDKETRKFRGFGFVTYESEEAAQNVLKENFHELKDKTVEVKIAKPKGKMETSDLDSREDYGSVSPQFRGDLCIYDVNNQPNYHPQGRYYYNVSQMDGNLLLAVTPTPVRFIDASLLLAENFDYYQPYGWEPPFGCIFNSSNFNSWL